MQAQRRNSGARSRSASGSPSKRRERKAAKKAAAAAAAAGSGGSGKEKKKHRKQKEAGCVDGAASAAEEQKKMGYFQMARLGYQELVNAIIRPPRADYKVSSIDYRINHCFSFTGIVLSLSHGYGTILYWYTLPTMTFMAGTHTYLIDNYIQNQCINTLQTYTIIYKTLTQTGRSTWPTSLHILRTPLHPNRLRPQNQTRPQPPMLPLGTGRTHQRPHPRSHLHARKLIRTSRSHTPTILPPLTRTRRLLLRLCRIWEIRRRVR